MNIDGTGEQRERIGIFGGSFNPIHTGHLLLAQQALECVGLDRILFMPCAVQPHKPPGALAAASIRQTMIEAAIMDNLSFDLLDIEIQRGGISYTVDSLREIRAMYPHADLYFLIGSDTLTELHGWKDIRTVLDLCRFVVFARPGTDPEQLDPARIALDPPWPERLLREVVTARRVDISASDIRHRVAEGMSIRYLVPQAVEMIIMEHRLYR